MPTCLNVEKMSFLDKIKEIIIDFGAVVYPDYCPSCISYLEKNEDFICTKCKVKLPKTGSHLPNADNKAIVQRFEGRVKLAHTLSYLYFKKGSNVQTLLHKLKYASQPLIGEKLGLWYGTELYEQGFKDVFDIIVPVPLHALRQKKRGYNQSEAFGKGLAQGLNIEQITHAFVRTQYTDTQTKKQRMERADNVENIFHIKDISALQNKRILLVDDVVTTGATLFECVLSLEKAQPKSISVATIAAAG